VTPVPALVENTFDDGAMAGIYFLHSNHENDRMRLPDSELHTGVRDSAVSQAQYVASPDMPLRISLSARFTGPNSLHIFTRSDGTLAVSGYRSENEVLAKIDSAARTLRICEVQNGSSTNFAELRDVDVPYNQDLAVELTDNGSTVTLRVAEHTVSLHTSGAYPNHRTGIRSWTNMTVDDYVIRYGEAASTEQPPAEQEEPSHPDAVDAVLSKPDVHLRVIPGESFTVMLATSGYTVLPEGGEELAAYIKQTYGFNGHYEQAGPDRDNAWYLHDSHTIWQTLGPDGTFYRFPDENIYHGSWAHKIPVARIPVSYYEDPASLVNVDVSNAAAPLLPAITAESLSLTIPETASVGDELRYTLIAPDGSQEELLVEVIAYGPQPEEPDVPGGETQPEEEPPIEAPAPLFLDVAAPIASLPVVSGLTPDRIRASFTARVTEAERRMEALSTQREATAQQYAEHQKRITELQQIIEEANAITALAEAGQNSKSVSLNTAIRFNVYSASSLDVYYTDAPEGMVARLYKENTIQNVKPIPAGTGHVNFAVPLGGLTTWHVEVASADTGEALTDQYHFQTFRGGLTRRGTANHQITSTQPVTPVSEEKLFAANVAKQAAVTERQTLLAEQDDLQEYMDEADAAIRALKAETIPYSRMHVAVAEVDRDHVRLSIRVSSPLERVRVEMLGCEVADIEEEGGIQDTTIFMTRRRNSNDMNRDPLTIVLLGGENLDTELERAVVAYQQEDGRATILTPQPDWDRIETGRLAELPVTPALNAMAIDGVNVVLHVASAHDTSFVAIDGGGVLSSAELDHEGGHPARFVSLAFDATKPTGNYAIRLGASPYARELTNLMVHWDKETMALSLASGDLQTLEAIEDAFIQSEAAAFSSGNLTESVRRSLIREANYALDLEEASLSFEKYSAFHSSFVTNTALQHLQQIRLYQESSFWISGDVVEPYVDEAMQRYYPDRLDNAGLRSDLASNLRGLLDAYEESVGGLLTRAVDLFAGVRAGHSEYQLRAELFAERDRVAGLRYMTEIAIMYGIYFPSAAEIYGEGRRLYETEIDLLLHMQSEDDRLLAREAAFASNREYQLAHGVPPLDTVDDGPRASAENGYQGYLEAGGRRRLARAERLLKAALERATGRSVQVRIVDTVDANASRMTEMSDGTLQVVQTMSELDAVAARADETLREHSKDPEAAAGVVRSEYLAYACSIQESLLQSGFISEEIALSNGTREGELNISLNAHGKRVFRFTLLEPAMVNFWVNVSDVFARNPGSLNQIGITPDLSISLAGSALPESYVSQKPGVALGSAGESVSTVLPAGEYELTVSDVSDPGIYTLLGGAEHVSIQRIPLGMNIKPYNTAKMEGRISIPQSAQTMPVSMSVAEFKETDSNELRRKEFGTDDIGGLNPNEPVWVVVHGMNSKERADTIDNLARALYQYTDTENIQVVTVNWEDAAKDALFIGRDAPWTVSVGKWVAQQLLAAGFQPGQINGAGHSHGSYVLFEMGQQIQRIRSVSMNALVALDPAGNNPAISGYEHGDIAFSSVAQNSIAFESSLIADSDWLASTAHAAFHINSPSTYAPWKEHSLGLTAFTEILKHGHDAPGSFSEHFALQRIMSPASSYVGEYIHDVYEGDPDIHPGGEFEGTIHVSGTEENGLGGTYIQAHPLMLRFWKPCLPGEQFVNFDSYA